MIALTEELLLNAQIFFIPDGTSVDGGTASISSLPDNDPATNWTDFEFGCINRVQWSPEYKEEDRECADTVNGGYRTRKRRWVDRDMFDFTTLEYNENHHRLAFGIDGAITPGTGQTPFATKFREIDGWLRIVAGKEDGTELCTGHLWVRLRLGDVPEWANASGSPVYQIEYLSSGSNDLDDITFAA
ncbi:MAG: hypothetical protein AAGI48_17705 [Verrucomicrobiota bacterium]